MPAITVSRQYHEVGDPGPALEIYQHSAFVWQGTVLDQARQPVDIAARTIKVIAEPHTANVATSGGNVTLSDFVLHSWVTPGYAQRRSLAVTKGSTTGTFAVAVPDDVWPDEISFAPDRVPVVVCHFVDELTSAPTTDRVILRWFLVVRAGRKGI